MQRVRAEGGGLDVVLDAHRHTERGLDRGGEVELVDAEVHGVDDPGRARLDLTRDADPDRADRGDVDAGVRGERAHRVEDGADDGIRAPARREAHAADDRAAGVDGDGIRLRAADVQPDLHRPTSLREAAWFTARISP